MDLEEKRTFNLWEIEMSYTQETGSEPATTRSNNKFEFVIGISNEKESKLLPI